MSSTRDHRSKGSAETQKNGDRRIMIISVWHCNMNFKFGREPIVVVAKFEIIFRINLEN